MQFFFCFSFFCFCFVPYFVLSLILCLYRCSLGMSLLSHGTVSGRLGAIEAMLRPAHQAPYIFILSREEKTLNKLPYKKAKESTPSLFH